MTRDYETEKEIPEVVYDELPQQALELFRSQRRRMVIRQLYEIDYIAEKVSTGTIERVVLTMMIEIRGESVDTGIEHHARRGVV